MPTLLWAAERRSSKPTACENPFEIRHQGGRKVQVPIKGEWIGKQRKAADKLEKRSVELYCRSSTISDLPSGCLDAVLTDSPYFANVQYAELMDFCYIWLRRLVIDANKTFDKRSTRDENELTGNITVERGLADFTEGLAGVFVNMARALKPGAPLIFTYHHNTIEAYLPVIIAILDAGLTCSASIPCPAEMGASIHINGTNSSIIDTVFVCRSTGSVSRRMIVSTSEGIARLVKKDLELLRTGNVKPTRGDIRCVAYGHLVRLAVWNLRKEWKTGLPAAKKLEIAAQAIKRLGGWSGVEQYLADNLSCAPWCQNWVAREEKVDYGGEMDEISFP